MENSIQSNMSINLSQIWLKTLREVFSLTFFSLSFNMCLAGSSHKPFECRAGVQADLVLLVDGSWSIGRTNFKKVREFLEGLVTPFHIGPYGVQFGKTDLCTLLHIKNTLKFLSQKCLWWTFKFYGPQLSKYLFTPKQTQKQIKKKHLDAKIQKTSSAYINNDTPKKQSNSFLIVQAWLAILFNQHCVMCYIPITTYCQVILTIYEYCEMLMGNSLLHIRPCPS